MRRPAQRVAVVLAAAAAALAACGGGSGGSSGSAGGAASTPAPAAADTEPAIAPCAPAARAAVGRAAHAAGASMRTTGVSPGLANCVYRAGAVRVLVAVDANPQADVRFSRAVVERDQNALWSHDKTHAPRLLQGIGQGADWFPADRELLATDGRRLLSVSLLHAELPSRRALALAKVVARRTLARLGASADRQGR